MIIFFYGQDSFRISQKTKEIIDKYQEKHKTGLNLKIIDKDNIEEVDIVSTFSLNSMFGEKKLIILKDLLKNKEIQDIILAQAKTIAPVDSDTIFLITEKEFKDTFKKTKFFKFLEKNSKIQEFKPLSKVELNKWILNIFKQSNFKFEKGVPEKLIEYIGNDLWSLSNEINKILIFKQAEKEIKLEDIEFLIKPKFEANIFNTIDQLARGKRKPFLNMVHIHLDNGDQPLYILSMIVFQLRNLIIAKELVSHPGQRDLVLKSLGINPFVLRKVSSISDGLDLAKLKTLYQKVFNLDNKIKIGEIEPILGLDLFISEI